jgi:thioredoxin-like negative regulator of GroEL
MTFEELQKLPGKHVVVFYGIACAPCKTLKPMLRQACERIGQAAPVEINIAGELAAAQEIGVRTVPTVVGMADGRPRILWTGVQPPAVIERILRTQGFGQEK